MLADFLYRLHDWPTSTVNPEVVDDLRRLIPCDIATYREVSPHYLEVTSGVDATEATPIWAAYDEVRHEDPLPGVGHIPSTHYAAPSGVAMRTSDVIADRAFRQSGFFSQLCRPLGTRYILKLFVETPHGMAGVVLESASHDFSARDVALATSLAPHFQLARRRQLHRDDALGPLLEILTPRQRDVVRLVATGMSNAQIAAVLFLSRGTVRKHLDNIYTKTGTRNRTELATRTIGKP